MNEQKERELKQEIDALFEEQPDFSLVELGMQHRSYDKGSLATVSDRELLDSLQGLTHAIAENQGVLTECREQFVHLLGRIEFWELTGVIADRALMDLRKQLNVKRKDKKENS